MKEIVNDGRHPESSLRQSAVVDRLVRGGGMGLLRLVVRAVAQFGCWLNGGHDWHRSHETGRLMLTCAECGTESSGWRCEPTLELPPITVRRAQVDRPAARWSGRKRVA